MDGGSADPADGGTRVGQEGDRGAELADRPPEFQWCISARVRARIQSNLQPKVKMNESQDTVSSQESSTGMNWKSHAAEDTQQRALPSSSHSSLRYSKFMMPFLFLLWRAASPWQRQ